MPNLLGEFEARLGKVVEGTFGAMFRSPVQPAELAREAGKEMARSRKLGLDKMYVANVYFVFISPRDADAMGDLVPTIEGEMETYLLAFARERDYSFVTRPVVRFSIDEKIKRQGKFDIIGLQMTAEAIYDELGSVAGITDDIEKAERGPRPAAASKASAQVLPLEPPPAPEFTPNPPVVDSWSNAAPAPAPANITHDEPVPVPDILDTPNIPSADERMRPATSVVPGATAVTPTPAAPAAAPIPAAKPSIVRVGSLILPGRPKVELDSSRSYTLGRQSTCDFPIADANISRQHAELFWDGEGWSIRDLGSTNGTSVNGHKITSAVELHDGDRINLGVSTLIYHETSRMK